MGNESSSSRRRSSGPNPTPQSSNTVSSQPNRAPAQAPRSSGGTESSASATNAANHANQGPGAYKMIGQPRNQRFYVTIPRGVRPNQHFAVLVNGQQMMVRCPENNVPGERLIVTAPRQEAQQYVVTIPQNVHSGQQFRSHGDLSRECPARAPGHFPTTYCRKNSSGCSKSSDV